MRHLHPTRSAIIIGSLASVAFAFGLGLSGPSRGLEGIGKDIPGFLGLLSEDKAAQAGNGGLFLFEQAHDPHQRAQQRFDQSITGRRQEGAYLR